MAYYYVIAKTDVLENKGCPDNPCWKKKFGSNYVIGQAYSAKEIDEDRQHLIADLFLNSNPALDACEVRNSSMYIQYANEFEVVTYDEGQRRLKVDPFTNDPDEFFSQIRTPHGFEENDLPFAVYS